MSTNFQVDFDSVPAGELAAAKVAIANLEVLVVKASLAADALNAAETAYWKAVNELTQAARSGDFALVDSDGEGEPEDGKPIVTVPGFLNGTDYGDDVETAQAFDLWVPSHLAC